MSLLEVKYHNLIYSLSISLLVINGCNRTDRKENFANSNSSKKDSLDYTANKKVNYNSEYSNGHSSDKSSEEQSNLQIGTCKSKAKKNAINLKKKPIYAILLAGQSNMAGSGSINVLKRLLCAGGIKHESITDCANLPPTSSNIFQTLHDIYLTEKNQTLGEGGLNTLRSSYNEEAVTQSAFEFKKMIDEGLLTGSILEANANANIIQFEYGYALPAGNLNDLKVKKGKLKPGFAKFSSTIGPELMFGTRIAKEIKDVLIIKVVRPGSNLFDEWRSPSVVKKRGKFSYSLYDFMLEHVNSLQNNFSEYFPDSDFPELAGRPVKIVGFVWFQGWSDALREVQADGYEENLFDLIADLKQDLQIKDLPVAIVKTHSSTEYAETVRKAQEAVGEKLSPKAAILNSFDLSRFIHFEPAAYLTIGKRMAEGIYPLVQKKISEIENSNTSEVTEKCSN